jgi:hypothetical protein
MRRAGIALGVLAAEAVVCLVVAGPGHRLRLFVDALTVQGIVIAIGGAFLVVDAPFAAARAVRRASSGAGPGEEHGVERSTRLRWGLGFLALGSALFGAASLIWAVAG